MTQINSNTSPSAILKWWDRLATVPGGNRLFSFMLGRIAPYSGSITARVEELRPGYARVGMRDRHKLRNHLKSIHAIALINLGEIATGLAALSSITGNMRGIVVNIECEYVKKARGRLTAVAEFQLPEPLEDNTACEVVAEITDQSKDVVARVTASWLVGYKS